MTSAGSQSTGGVSAAGEHVERVIAADAGEVEHLGAPIAVRPRRQKVRAVRLAQQRRDDVATRVEIGGDEHQLAKPGCPRFSSSTSA